MNYRSRKPTPRGICRVSGESWPRIILFEIMPNMSALVAAAFIFATIFAVLGEAGLEFIGLGDINAVTWGTILYWAQNNQALLLHAWYWRYRYGNATTADFIALAERVSGRDLRAFFDAWLYAPSKPARP